MAKKKSKKKDSKKKDLKKKKLKKALRKKKENKKKDQKKKESKKKRSGKKQKKVVTATVKSRKSKDPVVQSTDHSSNYTVILAIEKLRAIKDPSELQAFTKGETRITINKAIPAAMSRLSV